MTPNATIPEIDFLPADYREKHSRLQVKPWRLIFGLGLMAAVAVTAAAEHHRRHRLAAELSQLAPQYEAALSESNRLASLQAELMSAQAEADLIAYLNHPWPRSRILDAVLMPLPDEVVLDEVMVRQENAGQTARSRADNDKAAKEKLKKLPMAARDLNQLRQQCDQQKTIVMLSGSTRDSAALYRYLGELAKTRLFAKAELASIEKDTKRQQQAKTSEEILHFSATLIVCPGYGQPEGPAGIEKTAVSAGQNSLSLRERAGVRGSEVDGVSVSSPHPNPLPEGDGTLDHPNPALTPEGEGTLAYSDHRPDGEGMGARLSKVN